MSDGEFQMTECRCGYGTSKCSCNAPDTFNWESSMEIKETGKKYDRGKTDYSLVQPDFIEGIANVLTYGAKQYGKNNWKNFGREESDRFYSAFMRHVEAVRAGQSIDPESGFKHIYHAAANLMIWNWLDNYKISKNGVTGISNNYPKNSSIS